MGIFKKSYDENKEELLPYYFAISSIESIGCVTYNQAQCYFASPKDLFLASPQKLEKCGIFNKYMLGEIEKWSNKDYILKQYDYMKRKGINYISIEDDSFPNKLRELKDAPNGLFFYGNLPLEDIPAVSVIGARECSYYGEEVAEIMGLALGKYGINVISGMARGIDSLSQTAALNAGGESYAVLGGGVDICYPRESRGLYESLKRTGAVISEYAPGVNPTKIHFARRNRLISGLCDALLVVEAKKKSGTLITVDYALEQGKDVFAIPGRITDRTSFGCNELIRQGAEIVNDPEAFAKDIILKYSDQRKIEPVNTQYNNEEKQKYNLSALETVILKIVSEDSFTIDELSKLDRIGQYSDVYELLTACMNLSYMGFLVNMGGGRFRKRSEFRIF